MQLDRETGWQTMNQMCAFNILQKESIILEVHTEKYMPDKAIIYSRRHSDAYRSTSYVPSSHLHFSEANSNFPYSYISQIVISQTLHSFFIPNEFPVTFGDLQGSHLDGDV